MVNDLTTLPATVTVAFPATGSGPPSTGYYEVSINLVSLSIPAFGTTVGAPWVKLLHRYEPATYSGPSPTNAAALTTLATQFAKDWYNWQTANLDQYFTGIVPWTPEGFHDIEWRQAEGRITTHLQRGVFNPNEDLLLQPPNGPIPQPPTPPSITDPAGGIAFGPPFKLKSPSGTIDIQASGNNPGIVNLDADLGPFKIISIKLCDNTCQCIKLPIDWIIGTGDCPDGTPAPMYWYCMEPPACTVGPCTDCLPCLATLASYCIAYGPFNTAYADSYGCDSFATGGYQTVTQYSPCVWAWQDTGLACWITMVISGGFVTVLFGNGPLQGQLAIYQADASKWDCNSKPLTLPIVGGDTGDQPFSVTVYPGACPPPVTPCKLCDPPPPQLCLTIPSLTPAIGSCLNCADLANGVTLNYSDNLFPETGLLYCGWIMTFPSGRGCTDSTHADHPSVMVLYYDYATDLWTLSVGGYFPAIYTFASTWDCTTDLTLNLDTSSTSGGLNDCSGWPMTVTISKIVCPGGSGPPDLPYYCMMSPAVAPPVIFTAPSTTTYTFQLYGAGAYGSTTDAPLHPGCGGQGGECLKATINLDAGDTVELIAGQSTVNGNGGFSRATVLTGTQTGSTAEAAGGPGFGPGGGSVGTTGATMGFTSLGGFGSGTPGGIAVFPPEGGSGGSGCGGNTSVGTPSANATDENGTAGGTGGTSSGGLPNGGDGGTGASVAPATPAAATAGTFPGGGGGGGGSTDGTTFTAAAAGAVGAVYIDGVQEA